MGGSIWVLEVVLVYVRMCILHFLYPWSCNTKLSPVSVSLSDIADSESKFVLVWWPVELFAAHNSCTLLLYRLLPLLTAGVCVVAHCFVYCSQQLCIVILPALLTLFSAGVCVRGCQPPTQEAWRLASFFVPAGPWQSQDPPEPADTGASLWKPVHAAGEPQWHGVRGGAYGKLAARAAKTTSSFFETCWKSWCFMEAESGCLPGCHLPLSSVTALMLLGRFFFVPWAQQFAVP